MKILLKIGAASVAFVPMLVLLSARMGGVAVPHPVMNGCAIFNFPALSLLKLVQSYHVSQAVETVSGIALLSLWSSLIAWFFWRTVVTFQGDDESEDRRGKYDWTAFQIRFVIGFVIGGLMGWRFVRYTDSMRTLVIASIVAACVGGFAFGVSQPPDFGSRP